MLQKLLTLTIFLAAFWTSFVFAFDCAEVLRGISGRLGTPISVSHFSESQIKLADGQGKDAAELNFHFEDSARTHIWIGMALVNPAYTRNGLYETMTQMLLEKYPSIRTISAILVSTNRSAYVDALKSGLSPQMAIKETPAYKSRTKLGFTKIETESKLGMALVTTFPTSEECEKGRTPFLVLTKP